VPVAITVKVADWPSVTDWLTGWVLMAGLMAVTVSVAGELVTVPDGLETTTVNRELLSPIEFGGVV